MTQLLRSAKRAAKGALQRWDTAAVAFERWRAREQEADYLRLREGYYRRAPALLSPSPHLAATRLAQRWKPRRSVPRLKDAHVMVVASDDWEADILVPDLRRTMDVTFHNMGPELRAKDFDAKGRAAMQHAIVDAVRAADEARPVDLVLAYGHHRHFDPATLRAIQASGPPVSLLCLDDRHSFDPDPAVPLSGQRALVGSATLHVTDTREAVRWYLAEDQVAFYLPPGCRGDAPGADPDPASRTYPVTFVGENYGPRARFIRKLQDAGVPVQCWGKGWPNGFLPMAELPEVFRRSLIVLGMGWVGHMDRVTCLKGRDFDAPASGALYLTSFDFELAQQFHVGRELACYANEIDAVEQIRYFLGNPDEAVRMGQAGRRRALAEHTWSHRFADLLRWMGIVEDDATPRQ